MMDELFTIFDEIGLPYFRQGTLSDEDYPASFFTFWNYDSPELAFYDNDSRKYVELIQVCFYTNNANLIYSVPADFINRVKAAGFIINGRGKDTPSGKDNYYGRLINITKMK